VCNAEAVIREHTDHAVEDAIGRTYPKQSILPCERLVYARVSEGVAASVYIPVYSQLSGVFETRVNAQPD
jgi:hypothetical protein